jgi:hypothetical protein
MLVSVIGQGEQKRTPLIFCVMPTPLRVAFRDPFESHNIRNSQWSS